jgi:hypothetical protein
MTFSIEIVKEGFISKKYAFSGRTQILIHFHKIFDKIQIPQVLIPHHFWEPGRRR